MSPDLMMSRPLFVTFEGIDACGKSTQIKLLADFLHRRQIKTTQLRDPGSTRVSEAVRNILLDRKYADMSPWAELLLYEAARAQLVQESVLPALKNGFVVLCDRFYDSTTAYQGFARQLDPVVVEKANAIGSCGLIPDLTIFIDIDVQESEQRKQLLGHTLDRMEAEGRQFLQRVRDGYQALWAKEPNRIFRVNGSESIETVQEQIQTLLIQKWKDMFSSEQ